MSFNPILYPLQISMWPKAQKKAHRNICICGLFCTKGIFYI